MDQVMASMAGLRGSSQAVLGGSLQLGGLGRLCTSTTSKIALARPGLSVRAQQGSGETETSRRAILGHVAAGIASESFVEAVLADGIPIKVVTTTTTALRWIA